MTLSIGPDVAAILGAPDTPGVVTESNFSAEMDQSTGTMHIGPKSPAATVAPDSGLIAGKFKSQDDLLAAYKELEAKLGKPAEATEPAPDQSIEAPDGTEPIVEAPAGLDLAGFSTEFAETGALSEDSFTALEAAGIPRAYAETFTEGFKAIQTLRGQQIHAAAGGAEEYAAITAWGTQNLSPEQQGAFNTAIDTAMQQGDYTSISMMISGVKAQMGSGEPQLLTGRSGNGVAAVEPFASRAEMAAAMRDPAYSRDGDYVASVQRRLAVSTF
jgi:hypothetical protein